MSIIRYNYMLMFLSFLHLYNFYTHLCKHTMSGLLIYCYGRKCQWIQRVVLDSVKGCNTDICNGNILLGCNRLKTRPISEAREKDKGRNGKKDTRYIAG